MSAAYNDMLNDHLHYSLLKEELKKKNYLWMNGTHDEEATGDIIVPFQSSRATSVKLGAGPTAESSIHKASNVRGSLAWSARPKLWMSMSFDYEDIINHEGKVKAKSFLGKFLPDQIEEGTDYFSETVNHMFLNSAYLATVTVDGGADGLCNVDHPERLEIGQEIVFDLATDVTGFVSTINMDTGEVLVVTARGGATPRDTSTAVAGTRVYQTSFESGTRLTSLRDILLSQANGGSANIYGVSKLSSKFTQAVNFDGTDVDEDNILEKIFLSLIKYRRLTKVGVAEIWVDSKNGGAIMKLLEQDSGAYRTVPGSAKVSAYGFTEIQIFGPGTGAVKFVILPDMNDDVIYFMDPKAYTIHSNGGIRKVKTPDGNLFTPVRSATTGFSFLTDLFFQGDIVVHKPHRCGIMHTISYTFAEDV